MSGLDEQLNDVPICPNCGKRPDYWVTFVNGESVIWFYSNNYKKNRLGSPYNRYMCEGKKLRLTRETILDKAQCFGNGCHTVFKIDKYPQLLKYLQRLFYRYFPDEMYGTD